MTIPAGLLAGCSGPYSALDPAGPAARTTALMWWGLFSYFSLVLVVVIALFLYALRRDPDKAEARETGRVERRWLVGGGLVLPSASIAVILALGIPMGHSLLPLPPPDGQQVVRIDVTGRQWHWEIHYPGTSLHLVDELHIPAGLPVDVHLRSADVIHSFWVPRLAHKLDAIPGHVNVLRLVADEPGSYRGQCAEFCGLGHAHMDFVVHAHTPEDFYRWLEAAPPSGDADD
jgi:cytochrome c oxidase subunit II